MNTKPKELLLLFALCSCSSSFTQIIPESIGKLVLESDYIFEGKVVRSDAYWNQANNFIYTSHTIEISKIFKGDLLCGSVELLTIGGEVQNKRINSSHVLELMRGDIGIFCATTTNYEHPNVDYYSETNPQVLNVVRENQGYFKHYFDDINPACSNLVYQFDSLETVYDSLQIALQINYLDCETSTIAQEIKAHMLHRKKANVLSQTSPYISYITPNRAYAGIGQVITLYGSNFGNDLMNGKVFIPNANRLQYWGAEYVPLNNSIDILFWSDTIIEFILPSITEKVDTNFVSGLTYTYRGVPGTGSIVIQNDLGETSPEFDINAYIEVPYAVATQNRYDSINQKYIKPRVKLIDSTALTNRYIFHVDMNIKSDPVKFAIVQKAINDWACFSNVYYRLDTTLVATSSNYDSLNSITWGTTPGNNPGITFSTNVLCQSDLSLNTYEIDIIFEKDSVKWWYDLNPNNTVRPFGQVDFYQAVLHELGHSHMLYHVVDSGSLMFSDQGYLRNINLLQDSSASGGIEALGYSLNNPSSICGLAPPRIENCPTLSIDYTATQTKWFDIYPNPFSDNFIHVQPLYNCNKPIHIILFDVFGNIVLDRQILVIDGNIKEINLQNIAQGIYTLYISDEPRHYLQRIIKQ